jgi:energy-coupling factor transporter ATP-binding protein EcfA2
VRIAKISVKGLFGMFDHVMPLNQESRITIVHGPNGVGKSVLMRMVHGLFHYAYEILGQTPFESMSVFFENGGVIQVHRISKGDVLLVTYVEENGSLASPPFEVTLTSENNLFTETERLLPDSKYVEGGGSSFWEVEEEVQLLDDFPAVPATRRMTQYNLLEEYPQIHSNVYGEMPDWFSKVRKQANTSLIQTQRLISNSVSGSELAESRRLNELDEGYHFPHPEYAVDKTRLPLGVARAGGDARNLFEDIINVKFLFKSIEMGENSLWRIVDRNGNEVDEFNLLSSGEQHILILFDRLLFKTKPDTLVMIDEPELSMNVVWQRNFLKDLQRIVELRKFDVLIATHSPQIIHDKWDWMVPLGEKMDD